MSDALLHALPAAILVVDAQRAVVDSSDRACRLFGTDRGGLVGRRLETLIDDDQVAHRIDGATFPVEVQQSTTEDGRLLLLHVADRTAEVALHDSLRSRTRLLEVILSSDEGDETESLMRDLVAWQHRVDTSQEDPETILQQLAERARALTNADGVSLSMPDGDGMTVRVSGSQTQPGGSYRIPLEGSLGGWCYRTGQVVHVEDSEADPRTDLAAARAIGARSIVLVPLRSGDTRYGVVGLYAARPRAFSSGALRIAELLGGLMSAALHHASEQARTRALREETAEAMRAWQASESRFRAFMDASPTGAYMKDSDGTYLYVNRHLQRVFQRPQEEWIGRKDIEIWPPDVGSAIRQNDLRVFDQSDTAEVVESALAPNGTLTWWLSYKFPIELPGHGRVLAGVSVDITELRRAQEAAEQASAAKSHFLATLSHEIRTPMNAVIATYQALASMPLDAEARRLLDLSDRQARHLLMLLEDLMNLSRIEAGRIELRDVAFDLARVIDNVTASACTLGTCDLHVDIAPDVPPRMQGDPDRLQQVLQNLVGNAVKFGGDQPIRVNIGSDNGDIRFTVEDRGPGVPTEMRARIFEPFVQSESSRDQGGLGLGLAIASRLVAAMQGHIWLDESHAPGARFCCTIPLRPAVEEKPTPAPAPQVPNGMRVLLVEDNLPSQELALFLLRSRGHDVTVASNGLEALEAWAPGRFDVVLMDVQMPVMDGMEATRELRRREHGQGRTPVIALTAQVLPEQLERLETYGFDRAITKPIRFDELFRALGEVSSPLPRG